MRLLTSNSINHALVALSRRVACNATTTVKAVDSSGAACHAVAHMAKAGAPIRQEVRSTSGAILLADSGKIHFITVFVVA